MKAFIKTYGCQMNKYTSSVYEEALERMGYEMTSNENEAEIIIFNTCSVRKHAEDKVFGKLDALLFLKRRNPNLKIGIVGCMAQRLGDKLFEIWPLLDFVIGPNDIGRLKEAIAGEKSCEISSNVPSFSFPCQKGIKAYVPISFGCSNYCSYCIVPYTWGPLKSRKKDEIIKECESLLKNGIMEITLLGQDITSYGKESGVRSQESGVNGENLADILSSVAKIGVPRIRFLTSHPKGMNARIIETIANCKNICPSFHIPLQSGSNRVLSLMNRGYTFEYYFELIEKIRKKIPESGITTDIIVGFPGEQEEDFKKTQRALETIGFDSGFLFKYSPREGTSACKLKEDLGDKEKKERLDNLIKMQNEISRKINKAFIGKTFDVLVEERNPRSWFRVRDSGFGKERNPRNQKSLLGRTETDKIVIFDGEDSLIGKITPVVIEEASTYTLKGK